MFSPLHCSFSFPGPYSFLWISTHRSNILWWAWRCWTSAMQDSGYELSRTPLLLRQWVNKAYATSNRRTAAAVKRYGARPKGNLAAISSGICSATVSAPSHTRNHKASS